VLDYPEYATETGLNLQCTPGNDVECVTLSRARGQVVLFTTPAWERRRAIHRPGSELSTNSPLAQRMRDSSTSTQRNYFRERKPSADGEEVLEFVIQVASGKNPHQSRKRKVRKIYSRKRVSLSEELERPPEISGRPEDLSGLA